MKIAVRVIPAIRMRVITTHHCLHGHFKERIRSVQGLGLIVLNGELIGN